MLNQFQVYLVQRGYREFSINGNPSTAIDYAWRVAKVCEKENYTAKQLADNINTILEQYGLTTQDAILDYFAQNGEAVFEDLGGTIADCVEGTIMKVFTFPYNGNNELGTVNTVDILMGEGVVGLNDVMTSVEATLYPNPANSHINVSSLSIIDRVQITNVLGQVVMTKEIGANGANINIENLEAGNYFVTIYTKQGVATKKLLVK